MVIIHHGKPKADIVWRGTCAHCRSVMECRQSELPGKIEGQGDIPEKAFSRAACPVCKEQFQSVPSEELNVGTDTIPQTKETIRD